MQHNQFARGHDVSPNAVGGPARSHEWSAVTYNTLSCKPERLRHILHELRYNRFVGLQGTNRRDDNSDPAVTQSTVDKFLVFDFPCIPGGLYPTKGAGVIVAIHRAAFSVRNVVKVFVPPGEFSGRIGAVRVKRRDADFCVISAYIPVEPRTAAEQRKVVRIWKYVHWLIEQLPSRCVPILLCDANGRVGSTASPGIGAANQQRENFNGSELRRLLETQHLAAVNTFYAVGHTWRGPLGVTSRIDYVVLPNSLRISQCRVLHKSAAALQLIPAPGWRDHKPVQVQFHHVLAYGESHASSLVWDRDSMVKCLFYGEGRAQFLQAVEASCSDERWADVDGPEQTWQVQNQAIRDVSHRFFATTTYSAKRHPEDTKEAFEAMLAARYQLVSQPTCRISTNDLMHEDLRLLLSRWKLVTAFRRTRSRHDKLCKRDRKHVEM